MNEKRGGGGRGEPHQKNKDQAFNKYLGVPRETFPEFFMTIRISQE